MIVQFYNPGKGFVEGKGIDHILDHTHELPSPFIYLLSARWYHAAQHAQVPGVECVSDFSTAARADLIVISDFFLDQAYVAATKASFDLGEHSSRVLIFSDTLRNNKNPMTSRRGAMNIFSSERAGHFSEDRFHLYEALSTCNFRDKVITPMGCGTEWLPQIQHSEKIIILDEPHKSLIEKLSYRDDIRVALFLHALEVCRLLSQKGYRILSFSRTKSEELLSLYQRYQFIEIKTIGDWLPFSSVASFYGMGSLFFSFFPETFGYAIYENLQLGNGVIGYAEVIDAYVARQMQNSALISLYMSVEIASELIDFYFARYKKHQLRQKISLESNKLYSTNTFAKRLCSSL